MSRTRLGRAAVYARIKQVATTDYLPNHLAALKVGADEGVPINRYATVEELAQLRQTGGPVAPPQQFATRNPMKSVTTRSQGKKKTPVKVPNQVFVVHGRDLAARDAIFMFLRSIAIHPIEWVTAISMTKKGSPYVGDILEAAFSKARAVLVLLTPDDLTQLRPELISNSDPSIERRPTGQARPNVLFECGMAFASHPDRTIMVQLGNVKPFSDVAGRHVVHMSNDFAKRRELATKLKNAGCDIDLEGAEWATAGDFSDPEIKPVKGRKKKR